MVSKYGLWAHITQPVALVLNFVGYNPLLCRSVWGFLLLRLSLFWAGKLSQSSCFCYF